jgi:hypothetical protein
MAITGRTLRSLMMGPIQSKVGRRRRRVTKVLPMPRGRLLY